MLYSCSINEINLKAKGQVWVITRTKPKSLPVNCIWVPQLSPSYDLLNKFLSLKNNGQWNSDTFNSIYRPQFLNEMKNNPYIELLRNKSIQEDITLVCYCADESLCHRSIIRELVESKPLIRVLIAGSRSYNDYDEFAIKMDYMLSVKRLTHTIEIVSGGARGTDALARKYAYAHGYAYKEFQANWNANGKSAGYIRNERMHRYLREDDCKFRACICFWDGQSHGTEHNFLLCKHDNTPLRVWNFVEKKWM